MPDPLRLAPALAAALLLSAAIPAAAQQRTIAPGQTVTDRLTAADPVLADQSHYHLWRLDARPGDRLVVTMRSEEVDAFLAWGALSGSRLEVEDSNDDGGGGTDARLRITVPASGTHGIRANTFGDGEVGTYTLTVEHAPADAAPVPVRVGQSVRGMLGEGSSVHEDGSFYDLYLVNGAPGQRVGIEMRSGDLDAYLFGGRLVNGAFEALEEDDDGAGGTDARLEVTLDGAGRYAVLANTFVAGEAGTYTLTVQPLY
jgi:hypothetical protein